MWIATRFEGGTGFAASVTFGPRSMPGDAKMTFIRLPAVVALVLAASPVTAAETTTTVRGRVEKVDATTGRLDLTTADGRSLTLKTNNDTTVELDGQAAKLADLGTGQPVRVTYKDVGGDKQLVSVAARKTTGRDVAREVREALQAAGRYTYQQKGEYEKKLRGVVDDLDDRIDDLQKQARGATEDARRRLDQQVRDLKRKRAVVDERLKRVQSAGADAWDDVKSGVQNAVEDLRRALDGDRPKPD
jgi:gas vesicle protein